MDGLQKSQREKERELKKKKEQTMSQDSYQLHLI